MTHEMIKQNFAPGQPIPAAWCNELARRWNALEALPPLMYEDDTLAMDPEDASGVMVYPWQLYFSGALIQVRGGAVFDGQDYIAVDGVSDVPESEPYVWLRLKYYNGSSPTEAEIKTGAAWGTSDYADDVVPVAGGATPTAGWVEYAIRLGEVVDSEQIVQYQRSDIILPAGSTYTRTVMVGMRYEDNSFIFAVVDETYVGGVLVSVSDVRDTTIAATGPCPEEA